jgi:hypothetical protein
LHSVLQMGNLVVFGLSLGLAPFPGARPDHSWLRVLTTLGTYGSHACEQASQRLPLGDQVAGGVEASCTITSASGPRLATTLPLPTQSSLMNRSTDCAQAVLPTIRNFIDLAFEAMLLGHVKQARGWRQHHATGAAGRVMRLENETRVHAE